MLTKILIISAMLAKRLWVNVPMPTRITNVTTDATRRLELTRRQKVHIPAVTAVRR